MMTQTHLLIAVAVLARPQARMQNRAVVTGALLPDLAIYGLFVAALIMRIPQANLWGEVYWQAGWQSVFAIGNSVPLYLCVLLIALMARRQTAATWPQWLSLFACAALLHIAADFPVHSDDAHQHFWPLSVWRFYSPLSYWNDDHHGLWVALFESALGLACAALIIRRFRRLWVTVTVCLLSLSYLLRPLLMTWDHFGS